MLLTSAKRKTRGERQLDFEGLEARVMLAANVDGAGNLTIDGTAGNDQISVLQNAAGNTIVIANAAVLASTNAPVGPTPIGATGLSFVVFNPGLNDLNVNGLDGMDDIGVGVFNPTTAGVLGPTPAALTGLTAAGEVNVTLGEGAANRLTMRQTVIGTVGEQEALRVFGGSGLDVVDVRQTQLNEDLNIRTEAGNDLVVVFQVLIRNDAEIFTSAGNDTLWIGQVGIGTGEFTDDNLDVDMNVGNDIVNLVGPVGANPTVPGAVLNRIQILGGPAETDTINRNGNMLAATTVDVNGFEVDNP
jgi:hypothetical protein